MRYEPVWKRGKWVRRRYIVSDAGIIVPVPGTTADEYDPQSGREANEPAELLQALCGLQPADQRQVEHFCSRWGLLGLMHEEVEEALFVQADEPTRFPRLPWPHSPRVAPEEVDAQLSPVVSDYLGQLKAASTNLRTEELIQLPWDLVAFWNGDQKPLQVFNAAATVFDLADRYSSSDGLPSGLLTSLLNPEDGVFKSTDGDWMSAALLQGFGRSDAGRPSYQFLHHPEFWDWYQEPLIEFRMKVEEFQHTARLAMDGEQSSEVERRIAERVANARVQFGFDRANGGGWRLHYRLPSLLSTAYLLLGSWLMNGRIPGCCKHCGGLFLPKRSDAQFCRQSCQVANWRMESRRKGKHA